jgi:hypothetical protein
MRRLFFLAVISISASPALAQNKPAPDYRAQVAPIFTKFCTGCHNDEDHEGKFSLESFASLQKAPRKALQSAQAIPSPA